MSVPSIVQKHFFALNMALASSGLVPASQTEWPVADLAWYGRFVKYWPVLNGLIKSKKTEDAQKNHWASVWRAAYYQNASGGAALADSMWTDATRDVIKKYGRRMVEDVSAYVPRGGGGDEEPDNGANASGVIVPASTSSKGALPSHVWEKFGIKLPPNISNILEEMLSTLGTDVIDKIRNRDKAGGGDDDDDDDGNPMSDVFGSVQRKFVEYIQQGKITEQDIKDTIACFRNSLSGIAEKAPPELRGMVHAMNQKMSSMDRDMRARKKATATNESAAEAASSSDSSTSSSGGLAPDAPSAAKMSEDVNEISSLFSEFLTFVVDMQNQQIPAGGAHPFMKKMMKKAMTMMSKNNQSGRPAKLSAKERLQKLYAEKEAAAAAADSKP